MWTNKHRNWIEEGISLNWIDGVEHPNLKISNHTQYCNNKKEKNKKKTIFLFFVLHKTYAKYQKSTTLFFLDSLNPKTDHNQNSMALFIINLFN